jgi:DNA-binding FadR family transcriptional regulator
MTFGRVYEPRIQRRGLHHELVRWFGLRIVRGDYAPGEVLPRADELAASLGVSRTVLREAMKVLAEKGLIESRQRSGTRIRDREDWNLVDPEVIGWQREAGPDLQFLRDLSEVRLVFETRAARFAAIRATPEDIASLDELYQQMESSIGDAEEYARADLALHKVILRATHNQLLAQLTDTISEGLVASRDVTVRSSGASEASMPLHLAVVRAIGAHDPDAAEAAMTQLVERAMDDIESILAEPATRRAAS